MINTLKSDVLLITSAMLQNSFCIIEDKLFHCSMYNIISQKEKKASY